MEPATGLRGADPNDNEREDTAGKPSQKLGKLAMNWPTVKTLLRSENDAFWRVLFPTDSSALGNEGLTSQPRQGRKIVQVMQCAPLTLYQP